MKIIITGANGMAGSDVVRQAIADNSISQITAIVRKPLSIQHPKLKIVVHQNFMDYTSLQKMFAEHDACIWCLGISQAQVSKEKYIEITYDFCVAAAKAMLQANPSIQFLFLSGAGADSSEQSRTLFAKIKGRTENALQQMNFTKLFIVRPGGIRPMHGKPNAAWYEKILIPLFPFFELIFPNQMINSVQLADAMLYIIKNGNDKIIVENRELKAIAKSVA